MLTSVSRNGAEFSNSYTLAKIKLLTKGKFLFIRTISSTIIGGAVDSVIFYPLAFYGIWTFEQVIAVMLGNYALKVLWEVIATPFTYKFVNFLKKIENEDYYDWNTNFTPFALDTSKNAEVFVKQ